MKRRTRLVLITSGGARKRKRLRPEQAERILTAIRYEAGEVQRHWKPLAELLEVMFAAERGEPGAAERLAVLAVRYMAERKKRTAPPVLN